MKMGRCKPECWKTPETTNGKRLMISQGGKYPVGTKHGQCDECLQEEIEKMREALAIGDPDLLERWKGLKEKLK